MKYNYYATFLDTDEAVEVSFHDLPSVNTFGYNETHALEMAREALEGFVLSAEEENIEPPIATPALEIMMNQSERLVEIVVETKV